MSYPPKKPKKGGKAATTRHALLPPPVDDPGGTRDGSVVEQGEQSPVLVDDAAPRGETPLDDETAQWQKTGLTPNRVPSPSGENEESPDQPATVPVDKGKQPERLRSPSPGEPESSQARRKRNPCTQLGPEGLKGEPNRAGTGVGNFDHHLTRFVIGV